MTTPQPRPLPTARGLRRRAVLLGAVMALVLTACTGDRPSLGAIDPTTATTATTLEVTTTTPLPSGPRVLTPDDLLGWIATPIAEPLVYAAPSTEAEQLPFESTTAIGAPTTFAIIGDAADGTIPAVPGWFEVALPSRPNGSTGWVEMASVERTKTPLRLFISLTDRTLRVERDGIEELSVTVAIGEEDNPTPTNGTYVTELIESVEPEGAYGPYAFGLAMHSDTLTEFAGGPGQVGIHGTNQPALLGEAVSNGCIRLANEDIRALVDLQLPLGVPVFITA